MQTGTRLKKSTKHTQQKKALVAKGAQKNICEPGVPEEENKEHRTVLIKSMLRVFPAYKRHTNTRFHDNYQLQS